MRGGHRSDAPGAGAPADRLAPGLIAELACVLEVSARKPGNVTPLDAFEDASFVDFLLAAAALGRALEGAAEGVGRAVLSSVEGSRRLVRGNPNLGLALLLAPLAAASARTAGPIGRADVKAVLAALGPEDAALVYEAIRLAEPGGLGTAPEEDVRRGPPSGSLVEAMALAAGRDLVARQYSGGFREVFEDGVPALERALREGRSLETSIIAAHLALLAAHPDSLIARKCGKETAEEASRRSAAALAAGWPDSARGAALASELDRWLRADGHRRNPGTTADLVAASLFLAIRNGIIRFPLPGGAWRANSTGSA